MHPRNYFQDPWYICSLLSIDDEIEDTIFDNLSTPILESKYEFVDTDQVANAQAHLTNEQREALRKVLRPYQTLFDGIDTDDKKWYR
jgi:hypothetical protein